MPGLSVLHSSLNARYRFIPNALPFRPFPSGYASLHPNAPTRQEDKIPAFPFSKPPDHTRTDSCSSSPQDRGVWFGGTISTHESTYLIYFYFIISIIHNILKHHKSPVFPPLVPEGQEVLDVMTDRQMSPDLLTKLLISV